ncbi:MAG: hypothetical protein HWN67_19110 [Candidatus Helarchaeota archaeon]|nr:hypothetical protein [Candidatus Helarchaeota archaeon]
MVKGFNFYEPCSSDLFVGRERVIEEFTKLLQGDIKKSVFIHGRPGIGKTSLRKILIDIAKKEGFLVIDKPVPLIETEAFFDELGPEIKGIFKPKKPPKKGAKKKLGKNCPLIKRSYEISANPKYLPEFKKKFMKFAGKMGKEIPKKYKKGIAVFIDNAERFIYQGYDFAFDLFNLFSKKFEEETPKQPRIPIMFALIGEERYAPKIKYSLNNFEEIGLPKLNSALSAQLLAKRQKVSGILLDDEVKNKIFENSQGIPQFIIYNANTLIEENEGQGELSVESWKNSEGVIKDGFARELSGLSDNERKILHAFAMEPANFSDLGMIERATQIGRDELISTLDKLSQKGYVANEGETYFINMTSFWEFLRDSFGDIAITAQARTLINIAAFDAENGRVIDENLFNELENLRADSISAGLIKPVESIARGYERIANSSLNYDYYAEAFKFYVLSSDSFLKVNEIEKAASLFKEAAMNYKEKDKGDYSRNLLIKAVEIYERLGETETINELNYEIAENSANKAKQSLNEGDFPLARANFTRAERTYSVLGEEQKAIDLLNEAANAFFEKNEYYYAWQFYSRLINIFLENDQTDEASSIYNDSLKKFQTAKQNKFQEKLTDTFAIKFE